MKLSTAEASKKARQYVHTNYKNLPAVAFVMARKYVQEERRRNFEVRYADLNLMEDFVLLKLSVSDDGEVSLIKDRIEAVKKQLATKGTFLPDRTMIPPSLADILLRAIEEEGATMPEWFVGIKLMDGKSFDALITIKKSDGTGLDFPTNLFAKRADKAEFFKSFEGDHNKRVGLVMPKNASLSNIRKRLIDQLSLQRKKFEPIH